MLTKSCTRKFFVKVGRKNQTIKKKTKIVETKKNKFSDCVWIQYRNSEKNKIFVKTNYNDGDKFQTLVHKREFEKITTEELSLLPIVPYAHRLGISDVKKYILQLCEQGLVPIAHKNGKLSQISVCSKVTNILNLV